MRRPLRAPVPPPSWPALLALPLALPRSRAPTCVPFSRTKRGSAMDARLHTAVSSGLVYSTISVHRLLHLMVPWQGECETRRSTGEKQKRELDGKSVS